MGGGGEHIEKGERQQWTRRSAVVYTLTTPAALQVVEKISGEIRVVLHGMMSNHTEYYTRLRTVP